MHCDWANMDALPSMLAVHPAFKEKALSYIVSFKREQDVSFDIFNKINALIIIPK